MKIHLKFTQIYKTALPRELKYAKSGCFLGQRMLTPSLTSVILFFTTLALTSVPEAAVTELSTPGDVKTRDMTLFASTLGTQHLCKEGGALTKIRRELL